MVSEIRTITLFISISMLFSISRPPQARKIVYDYKNASWKGFRSDLFKAPWDSVFLENNIKQMWNKWKELFFAAVHNNIRKQHLNKKKNVPWLTSAIRRLFRKRKRLWKKAKFSQLKSDWDKYRQCRNKVKSELNKSHWYHFQSLINSDNPKRFWTFIKSKPSQDLFHLKCLLKTRKDQMALTKHKFFISVFTCSPGVPDQLRKELHLYTDQFISSLSCCESEVRKLLTGLNVSKAHGPDGIPARLLWEAAPAISA